MHVSANALKRFDCIVVTSSEVVGRRKDKKCQRALRCSGFWPTSALPSVCASPSMRLCAKALRSHTVYEDLKPTQLIEFFLHTSVSKKASPCLQPFDLLITVRSECSCSTGRVSAKQYNCRPSACDTIVGTVSAKPPDEAFKASKIQNDICLEMLSFMIKT